MDDNTIVQATTGTDLLPITNTTTNHTVPSVTSNPTVLGATVIVQCLGIAANILTAVVVMRPRLRVLALSWPVLGLAVANVLSITSQIANNPWLDRQQWTDLSCKVRANLLENI